MKVTSLALLLASLALSDGFVTPPPRVAAKLAKQPGAFYSAPIASSSTKLNAEAAAAESGGTATVSNEIFNLVKGIVGAGVLSLPAGM